MTPLPRELGHWREFSTAQLSSEKEPVDTCLKVFNWRSRAYWASWDMVLECSLVGPGPLHVYPLNLASGCSPGKVWSSSPRRSYSRSPLCWGYHHTPPHRRPSVCILWCGNHSKGIWSLLYVSSRESQMWLCQQVEDQRTTTPIPSPATSKKRGHIEYISPSVRVLPITSSRIPRYPGLSECDRHLDRFQSLGSLKSTPIKMCVFKNWSIL